MGCGSSTNASDPVGKPGKADVSSIETFDIEFNLDNVQLLYDYQHGQYLHPKDGIWDYDQLNSSSGFSYVDPKLDKKTRKLDDVITMRNLNLEQRKEMEDTNLWDSSEKTGGQILPKRVLPLYKPGDTISGHLVLDVSKPVDAKQIKLICSGVTYFYISAEEFKVDHIQEERQLWCKSKEAKHDDVNPEKVEVEEDYTVKENETLQDEETTKQNTHDGEKKETLAIEENKAASSEYIPIGKHRFPFNFKLPETCPSSVPNIASGSFTYVCINYRLKALIERRTLFGLGNVVQYRGIWVRDNVDISTAYSQYMEPYTLDQEFESTFNSGKITAKVTIPRRAFVMGESIQVEIEIDNQSGDAVIEAIEGRLSLEGKLHSLSYMEEDIYLKGKKERISVLISNGAKDKCTLKIPFNFSDCDVDNNLMPIAPGTIIKNEYVVNPPLYYIQLKLVRKGLQNENFDMKIPINIGTINSKTLTNNNKDDDLPTPQENALYQLPETCPSAVPDIAYE